MPYVLIVDDDPDMVTLFQTMLKGLQSKHVRDGEMALSLLQTERPSLVILDIMMDGVHGLHVLEKIRSDPRTASVPVVICSCLADEQILKKAKELGISDYIEKPFDPPQVGQRLKKLLSS